MEFDILWIIIQGQLRLMIQGRELLNKVIQSINLSINKSFNQSNDHLNLNNLSINSQSDN